jgi:hypothetical protein
MVLNSRPIWQLLLLVKPRAATRDPGCHHDMQRL